jgi:hypothetical protein
MIRNFLWVTALVGLCCSAGARAQICVYSDAEGRITYSNINETPPKGTKRLRCLKDTAPSATAAQPGTNKPPPRPDGQVVDQRTQQRRDDERRRILEQELNEEQERLSAARGELTAQEAIREGDERNYQRVLERLQPYRDRVQTHERNIQALQEELNNLK